MQMEFKNFLLSISDKVATVSINRPEKSNAFTLDMWTELKTVFDHVSTLPEARVVLLTGEGKNFCAGMDLNAFAQMPDIIHSDDDAEKEAKLKTFILGLQSGMNAIEQCRVPVIAAIQKACIGGGINLAAACDMRYCSDDAYFSIKEVDLGIVCDLGALQRMPVFMNPSIVAEMAYTGRKITASEAAQTGLVSQSLSSQEEMMDTVTQLAKTIAAKPPTIIRGIKKIMLDQRDNSVNDALDNVATHNSKHLFSEDLAEAMRAYMTKTEPKFKDPV